MRRLVYRLSQILVVLALGSILWGGWYLSHRGLSRKWRKHLVEEFKKNGVEISFRRLTLDPLRGLVAREVRVMDERKRMLAAINSVVLDLNYANLLHGQPSLNSLDLRDAILLLPSRGPGTKPLELKKLSAKIFLEPHQIHLSHAQANFYGIQVSANGRLMNPQLFNLKESGEPAFPGAQPLPMQRLEKLLDILKHEKKGNCELIIGFTGDFSRPEAIYVSATLSARDLDYGQTKIESLYAEAVLKEAGVELRHLNITDARGHLDASGSFRKGVLRLNMFSSLDPQPWGEFFPILNECVFYSVPEIELSARGDSLEDLQVTGQLALQRFSVRSASFEGLETGFSWKKGEWYLSDLQLSQRRGQLSGSVLCQAGNWRLRLESRLDPRALLPLTSGTLAQLLESYEFEQVPTITLNLQGTGLQPEQVQGSGELALGRTRIRGVQLEGLGTALEFRDGQMFCQKLKIARKEGSASGALSYDFGRHELRLDKIETNLVPLDVATCIDTKLAHDVAPYRFKGVPRLMLNGKIQFIPPKETGLEVLVNCPTGMDYLFLKKNLPANAISGRLFFTDGKLRISDLKANLFQGILEGEADISLRREDQTYTSTIRTKRIDFESLTKLFFQYDGSGGALNGEFKFSGKGEDARSLSGKGSLEVIDGNVFAIPLFGPLSKLFDMVLPGAGYQQAHMGAATFEVKDGIFETRDFAVKGNGFAMIGDGQLHFLDDKIDFDIRLNARGAPGVVLFPVSKLFEYHGEGSLSRPVWRSKRF